MSEFEIRLAENDIDRASAYRLRYELYVAGQGLFNDVADHKRRMLIDEDDEHAAIWVAEKDNEIVGTSRLVWGDGPGFHREAREAFDVDNFTDIVAESDIATASRMLVTPPYRGGPLVLFLCQHMVRHAVARGTEIFLGECEPHLINKWMSFGFRPFGLNEHPINGTLVRMGMVLGDHQRMVEMRSPLAPCLEGWSKPRDMATRLNQRLSHGQRVVSELEDRERFWATVESSLPRARLARTLGGLTDQELDALLGSSHAMSCDPGAMLIRKGHVSRTLYILLTGSLVVRDEGVIIVEVTEPGSVLGEVALFSGGDRMSDVLVGAKGARVLALSERSLQQLIETQGAGAAKFLFSLTRGLCTKLRERAEAQMRGQEDVAQHSEVFRV